MERGDLKSRAHFPKYLKSYEFQILVSAKTLGNYLRFYNTHFNCIFCASSRNQIENEQLWFPIIHRLLWGSTKPQNLYKASSELQVMVFFINNP